MFKPNEVKIMQNIVKVCSAIAGAAIVYAVMCLAIILEG